MNGGWYTSVGQAVDAVKKKIYDVARTALAEAGEDEVDVSMGYIWPAQWFDAVAVTAVRETPTDGTIGMQRRQHVDIRQDVAITTFRVTADEGEVHDRAYKILDIIDTVIRTDATLDGTVLWCYADDVASDGITAESEAGWGRICALSVTFTARAMITRPV